METALPPIERKNKLLYILGTAIFIIIIITLVLIFITAKQMPKKQIKTIIPVTKKTYIPTQAPLQKNKITFEVLNGSGIAGSAANGSAKLQAQGYSVIKIGNADTMTRETQLFLAEDLLRQQNEILNDLQSDFPSASLSGQLLGSTASARLIIGRE